MAPQATEPAAPALLFVPDISGFTQFVKSTEIAHSRHIIEELLEKLMDANELGLQVSEVEGDAILFYRLGDPPAPDAFFRQIRKMFDSFHGHLRLYETQRICQCGACVTAHALTLKIVAHYGAVAESRIKQHAKLFGTDVITVHRLLKNDIAHHEYALFTQALGQEWPPASAPEWGARQEGSQDYDVGRIDYGYVGLAPLRQFIPAPRTEDFGIRGAKVHVFSCEQDVLAPLDLLVEVVSDLPARLHWMDGAKDVEMLNHHLNRLGTKHRCVIDANSPIMITSGATRAADTVTLTETDDKKTISSVTTLRRDGEARTKVRIDGFIRDSLVLRALFALLMKKKLTRTFQASAVKLKHYCEALHEKQHG
ncbi:MAG: DUF2652 domain-containing protein [Gammaproteobacteria bacterium]|nr:DUF2652 domain-containing protein [Gammaproteobacteria bacterium]